MNCSKKKTVGLLTIGQSPRPDMTDDLLPIFGEKLEISEAGALDGLTLEQVQNMAPEPGDHFLVTRMSDGTTVQVAAHYLTSLMQKQVSRLEQSGVSAILILCTEAFQPFNCTVPIVYPNDVLKSQVPEHTVHGHIGIVLPDRGQITDFAAVWQNVVPQVDAVFGSPYASDGSLEAAAKYFAGTAVDLIVLDCMGYTASMQQRVAEWSGKPVYLAKTLAAQHLVQQMSAQP